MQVSIFFGSKLIGSMSNSLSEPSLHVAAKSSRKARKCLATVSNVGIFACFVFLSLKYLTGYRLILVLFIKIGLPRSISKSSIISWSRARTFLGLKTFVYRIFILNFKLYFMKMGKFTVESILRSIYRITSLSNTRI